MPKEEPRRKDAKITIPKPEMTPHKKFKCPLDQSIYETKEEYEKHCKEEHDVL